jgi:hypothetical protein
MGTWERFGSASEEVLRYVRSRFSPVVYLPLSLFLCAAAAMGSGFSHWTEPASAAALACAMLFQLRLWDDLADRGRDARRHPTRVLVKSVSLTKYRALVVFVFAVNATTIALGTSRSGIGAFVLLNVALVGWYGGLRRLHPSRVFRSHVLLLKYPAMVYVLSGQFSTGDPASLVLAMVLVYLCFCAYELLHDPELLVDQRPDRLLTIEMSALVTAPVWGGLLLFYNGWAFAALQGALALAAAAVAAGVLRLHRARIRTGLWVYAPFLIASLQVLTLSGWRKA